MKPSRPSSLAIVLIGLSALASILPPPRLAADDFAFHEASARAAALGGAFTARADDTAALFCNPAGLAFLSGFRFKTNITLGRRSMSAAWPEGGPAFTSKPLEILGGHAVSWQPIRRVTLATGLFASSGYDSVWNSAWSGRTVATLSKFQAHTFRTALAVEVVKDFALSIGLDVVTSNLAWIHKIPFNVETYSVTEVVESRHRLKGHGVGFVAGALWKIVPAVQVGASYRGAVVLDHAGSNVFAFSSFAYGTVPDPYGSTIYIYDLLRRFYKTQEVTGRLTLPREISCGLALTPLSRLSLYADVQWTRWSEFGDWTFRAVNADDELSPDFTSVYQEFYGIAPDYGTQGVAFALEDSKRMKAGIEYRPAEHFAVRVGYARHESSVQPSDRTPVYPDLERDIYSFGLGYEGPVFSIWRNTERVADLSFDVFARYATAVPGESAYPGLEMTYDSNRFTFGVGVGFIF
jgi:long-subunit fatty acid transport protein